MTHARLATLLPFLAMLLAGCSAPDGVENLGSLTQAVNACNETVPTNRFVDGLPAYAQCSGVSSGNIWSNNGIDTATASGGTDWIRNSARRRLPMHRVGVSLHALPLERDLPQRQRQGMVQRHAAEQLGQDDHTRAR
ncbi:MAG: hypothetical protein QM756_02985 [Polyangiaceae bacterium]